MKKSEWDAKAREVGDTVYMKGRNGMVEGTLNTVTLGKGPNAGSYWGERHYVKVKIEKTNGTVTEWRTFKALYDTAEEIQAAADAKAEKRKEEAKKKAAERKAMKELVKEVPEAYIEKIQEVLRGYRKDGRLCSDEQNKIIKKLGLPPVPYDIELYNVGFSIVRKDGGAIGSGWEIRNKIETLLMKEVPKGLWAEKDTVAEVSGYVVTRDK